MLDKKCLQAGASRGRKWCDGLGLRLGRATREPPPPPPHTLYCLRDFAAAEEDEAGEPPYVDMIRTALMKLPGRQGNLPMVCAYIEVCPVFLLRGASFIAVVPGCSSCMFLPPLLDVSSELGVLTGVVLRC